MRILSRTVPKVSAPFGRKRGLRSRFWTIQWARRRANPTLQDRLSVFLQIRPAAIPLIVCVRDRELHRFICPPTMPLKLQSPQCPSTSWGIGAVLPGRNTTNQQAKTPKSSLPAAFSSIGLTCLESKERVGFPIQAIAPTASATSVEEAAKPLRIAFVSAEVGLSAGTSVGAPRAERMACRLRRFLLLIG